ncbi:MAG: NADH-quinone oxidoreductase subunit N [Bacteriovoracaceae bacterium]|nr:NADH-quinone oxidoreductase subunit N [Bacteriovoracaceae bacterium]
MNVTLLSNLGFYVPELLIIFTLCAVLFTEAFYEPTEKNRFIVFVISGIGQLVALSVLMSQLGQKPTTVFFNAIVIDGISTFTKIIMVLGTMGVTYLSYFSKEIVEEAKSEFLSITLGVLVGGMLLVSANNLLTLYLGIETLSILSYILSSLKKNDHKSLEAGLKYALYGGLSAGLMVFGISHIYGLLGTIHFAEIAVKIPSVLSAGTVSHLGLLLSFLLLFVGLGFKIACVPFHMWSPDVYQGSPLPVTAFFSIVPKIAGLVAILRVTQVFFLKESSLQASWVNLLQMIAILTMTVGNISAIGQTSIKRLLAFSSIAHAGMMLLAVLVMSAKGNNAVLFYAFNYLFMTMGAFFIASFVTDKVGNDSTFYFKGLIHKNPLMACLMIMVLFSLAGIPPFSGFIAKFNIFSVLIEHKYYGVTMIAGINSVISLYYYMKLIKMMVFDAPEFEGDIEGFNFQNQVVILCITLPIFILGIFWEKIMLVTQGASIFIP